MQIVFTNHAEERIETRKILREEVLEAIKFPDLIIKKHGKSFFRKQIGRGVIEVCCELTERDISVITVYWV